MGKLIMRFQRMIKDLYIFFLALRRSGTSYLIKQIANDHDVYVLVANNESKKGFGEKAISIQDIAIHLDSLKKKPKPILLDNGTLIELLKLTVIEFESVNAELNRKHSLIKNIAQQIHDYERGSIKFKDSD